MSLLDLPTDILTYEIILWFRTARELYNYMILCKETYRIVKEEHYECNILFAITCNGVRELNLNDYDQIYAESYEEMPIRVTENFMQLLMFGKSYANYIGPKSVNIFNTSIPRKLFLWSVKNDDDEHDLRIEDVTRVVSFDANSYTVSSLNNSIPDAVAYFRDGKKCSTKFDMSQASRKELRKHIDKSYINRSVVRKNMHSLGAMQAIEDNPDIGNFCDPLAYRSYCSFTINNIDSFSDPILIKFRTMVEKYIRDVTLSMIVSDAVDMCRHEHLVGSQLLRAIGGGDIPVDSDYDLAAYDSRIFAKGAAKNTLDGWNDQALNVEVINNKRVLLRYQDTKKHGTDVCDAFLPDLPIDMLVKSFHFPCVHMYCNLENAYYCSGYREHRDMGSSIHFLPSAVIPIMTRQIMISSIRISANTPIKYRDDLIEKYKRYGYTFIDDS